MSSKENGNKRSTNSHFPAPSLNSEEKTAQYALAQDCLNYEWANNPRWKGIERPYTAEDVLRLRGSVQIEHTLARLGAERLWELLHTEPYVNALGAVTGNQAVQQVQAGLKAIYVSGWQVAADANNAGQMYPDQSLYPADSVPNLCRRINSALQRADQRAPPAYTLRTSFRLRKSADTSAARYWFRRRKPCRSWWRHDWPPM